jgi:hypothetical protein
VKCCEEQMGEKEVYIYSPSRDDGLGGTCRDRDTLFESEFTEFMAWCEGYFGRREGRLEGGKEHNHRC